MQPLYASAKRLDEPELIATARDASHMAYCPYSHFAVGAAVRTKTGNIYLGCNIENVSYSVTTCAERNAIAAAVTAEGPEAEISEIAVAARNAGVPAPCSPCGACRQAIAELAPYAKVTFFGEGMAVVESSAAELLPGAFAFESVRG